jgi:hypothetical protein
MNDAANAQDAVASAPAAAPAAPANVAEPTPVVLTPAQRRQKAVLLYYDTPSRADRKKLVQQYPELAQIFSAANHDS